MSCNGCRVLRKGCSDACILRSCLQWIESPEAQGHATVFVAKFFGRAGMMSFISAVSESQRPALFQSLLYEACGRTVNPVFGAVGLLWSGNWGVCQAAVETVLKGGSLKPATCLPSTKPIQPLVLNKSQAPSKNPASKRPHDVIDANIDINAETKRHRSADQHEEHSDSRAKADNVHVDPSINVIRKPVFMANAEVSKQEERPSQSGQLVAPVARRVKPQAAHGLADIGIREAISFREAIGVREHQQAFEEPARQSHESVELDLTLNSQAHHVNGRAVEPLFDGKSRAYTRHPLRSHVNHALASNIRNEEEHALFDRSARASSPCSFSMNSEGSVVSSDTAEFSVSCVRGLSSPTARHEDCQLLHLL